MDLDLTSQGRAQRVVALEEDIVRAIAVQIRALPDDHEIAARIGVHLHLVLVVRSACVVDAELATQPRYCGGDVHKGKSDSGRAVVGFVVFHYFVIQGQQDAQVVRAGRLSARNLQCSAIRHTGHNAQVGN